MTTIINKRLQVIEGGWIEVYINNKLVWYKAYKTEQQAQNILAMVNNYIKAA